MMNARLFAVFALICASQALFAMSVRPPSFEQLVGGAEQVLRTEVTDTRCVVKGEGAQRHIVTLVTVRVEKVIVGEAPAQVVLELLGGKVGEEGLEVGGMTTFHKGDRDILFVVGNGKYFCPLVAVNHGRYLLVPNEAKTGEFVARADNKPLHSTAEVSGELELPTASSGVNTVSAQAAVQVGETGALSVEAFEAKIVECAKGLKAATQTSAK